jgi:hypothetical protein
MLDSLDRRRRIADSRQIAGCHLPSRYVASESPGQGGMAMQMNFKSPSDGSAPYPHIVLDHNRLGDFPALNPAFHLKVMSGGIDLDGGPDHDMIADAHLIIVENGAHEIQIDMIADIDVPAVAAVEGWLNGRIPADLSQQLPEDGLSLGHGFGPIVEPEQFLGLLALSLQVRVKTVVPFSG